MQHLDNNILKFPDLLKVEGVMAKGFGLICKFPMLDTDLSVAAKSIYALLCAYAGNGDTAFPSRDKIVSQLGIGQGKYKDGMKQLREQGYITVVQNGKGKGKFGNNIYTIVSNPKKFIEQQYESDGGELSFGYTGLKSAGYGMLPRMVMFDPRLDCTAKAIYAYLASYSGAGKVAFPKTDTVCWHLGLSRGTFFKYMKQLVETNYITREQRHINGRLASNNYRLNDCPDEAAVQTGHRVVKEIQRIKNQPTVNQTAEEQPTKNQAAEKQSTEIQLTQKQPTKIQCAAEQCTTFEYTTNNSSFKNSSSTNINPSINNETHWMDGMTREEIIAAIREELEVDFYTPEVKQQHCITLTDETITYFICLIADFIYSRQPTFTTRSRQYTREEAISRLIGLSLCDYQQIFDQLSQVTSQIKNQRKYILTCMITLREDSDLKTELELNRDYGRIG